MEQEIKEKNQISKKNRNVANKSVSSNNIIFKYDLILMIIEFQLDINAIGNIIVVNNIKYIEIPSTPTKKIKKKLNKIW